MSQTLRPIRRKKKDMNLSTSQTRTPARMEYLKVRNFRALREVVFKDLTPLTVLLGPNGSGKSTVFDVFAFLSECFEVGLRRAWDRRGRAKELRTRGGTGPIVIELKYRELPGTPLITYHLAIDEIQNRPVVIAEWLHWRRKRYGKPFRFLEYRKGHGYFKTGLRKVEAARVVGTYVDPSRSRSHSFLKFREAIIEATA